MLPPRSFWVKSDSKMDNIFLRRTFSGVMEVPVTPSVPPVPPAPTTTTHSSLGSSGVSSTMVTPGLASLGLGVPWGVSGTIKEVHHRPCGSSKGWVRLG